MICNKPQTRDVCVKIYFLNFQERKQSFNRFLHPVDLHDFACVFTPHRLDSTNSTVLEIHSIFLSAVANEIVLNKK